MKGKYKAVLALLLLLILVPLTLVMTLAVGPDPGGRLVTCGDTYRAG